MTIMSHHYFRAITASCVMSIAVITTTNAEIFELELERALSNSQQILSSHKAYLSARENVIIASAPSEWSASVSVDATHRDEAVNGGNFNDEKSRSVTLNIKKKLYDGGVSSAQETVAVLALELALAEVAIAEEVVLLEAVRAYTALSSARGRLHISMANLARLEEHLRGAKLKVAVGESTVTELAETKARVARAKANLIQTQTSLANAEADYTSLIGVPPQQMVIADVPSPLPQSSSDAATTALTNKPSHRVSYLRERITRKTMDVLLAQVRPNLDLTLSGRDFDTSLERGDKESVAATVMFTMPLYPSSSAFAKSRGAVADHQKTIHDLIDNRRTTRLNAENAFRAYQAADAVIAAYDAELEAASAFRDGTAQEVAFGEKTLLDQLDAEQDVVTAQLNLLISRHDRIINAYDLLASAGVLTPERLGLAGVSSPVHAPEIENPIVGPFPLLRYTE